MNIVTAIFVNDAIEVAKRDHDFQKQLWREEHDAFIEELQCLFNQFDTDGSGTITNSEFRTALLSEDVRHVLERHHIHISDFETFFDVLDADANQVLEIDEFVMGCARYHGSSAMVEVEIIARETQRMQKRHCDRMMSS